MLFRGLRIAIGLLAITALVFSLTDYSAVSQTIPIPEFKPKAPESQDGENGQNGQTQQPESEPEPPRPTDFAMKVLLVFLLHPQSYESSPNLAAHRS